MEKLKSTKSLESAQICEKSKLSLLEPKNPIDHFRIVAQF